MKITIFTPTYNRAYILPKLYNSLVIQTDKDFEWLIVDDGSDDSTENLINSFIDEQKIIIRYYKQINGGKHRAINNGVKLAKGELFFIVDSDDQLPCNSLEYISYYYAQIKNFENFAGVCGLKAFFTGNNVGGDVDYDILDCNSLDFRYRYKIKGDMAEVFKVSILKLFPFPEFDDECFCPEATVWNRIASKYKLRYFSEKVYLCDYLPDGLTAKITKIRMRSPEASLICYSELSRMDIPFIQKIKASINYARFSFCTNKSFIEKMKQGGLFYFIVYPLAFIMHLNDKRCNP